MDVDVDVDGETLFICKRESIGVAYFKIIIPNF